jgi:hypothetical protein
LVWRWTYVYTASIISGANESSDTRRL